MTDSTPVTLSPGPALAPVSAGERLELIDVIRGFAVFGILLVNMQFFNSPQTLRGSGIEWFPDAIDRWVSLAIVFFAEGKFYSIFAMLFGLGLAIQMQRAAARGVEVGRLYFRRLLVLLLIGLVHAFLIWWGDILTIYAALGMLLMLFRNLRPRALVIWSIVLLAIPVLFLTAVAAGLFAMSVVPEIEKAVQPALDVSLEGLREGVESSYDAYALGSFGAIMRQRAIDVGQTWANFPVWGPDILAMFLIGLTLGKIRFLHDVEGNLRRIRRAMPWLFVVGVLGNGLYTVHVGGSPVAAGTILAAAIWILAAPCLAYFYVSMLVVLWQRPGPRRILAHLAPAGRMALTNYLTHSIVFTLVFYSYGLGLYGAVSPVVGLVLTVAMYAVQIPLSAWWLSRFRFGPWEWVWRSLTYGQPQPMRR